LRRSLITTPVAPEVVRRPVKRWSAFSAKTHTGPDRSPSRRNRPAESVFVLTVYGAFGPGVAGGVAGPLWAKG
jgi:hypothetical protein